MFRPRLERPTWEVHSRLQHHHPVRVRLGGPGDRGWEVPGDRGWEVRGERHCCGDWYLKDPLRSIGDPPPPIPLLCI
jgi:hypothetical protein